MRSRLWFLGLAISCVVPSLAACDEDPPPTDGGPTDGGADAGGERSIALEGLDGEVEVIVDDRGMPHIYATTIHDLSMVQGYLMARDRYAQMEFIRRSVLGTLGEVLVGASPGVVDDDRDQRFLGFGRQGRAIYASLAADDPTRLQAEAFVAGINAYIDAEIQTGEWAPHPGLEVFSIVVGSPNFSRWEPADVFALARFQAFSLSYDAGADVNRTRALEGVRAAFDPDSTDERLASRAGVYADFWSEVQARRVYTRDGFNDGTTMAIRPPLLPLLPERPEVRTFHAPRATLDGAARFFDRLDRNPLLRQDEHIGSNSWVVSGDHTESGNPILSNDPHLSLISPPVWWYVHLNTARMGGEGNVDAQGVAFAGLPGVVLGYNRALAWSATTTGYDVTDVYAEEVTYRNDGTAAVPRWVPVSVTFDGAQVNLQPITETMRIDGRADEVVVFHDVPHHGPLIPDSLVVPEIASPAPGSTGVGSAMSVRYTGHEPTNELAFFYGLTTASTVEDVETAQDNFRVGAQNFSVVTGTGDISWSTQAWIPTREAAALTFAIAANGTVSGQSPLFVLPGDGTAEWDGELAETVIPHDRNPAQGYIATANQDNVGVTDDGNPCNDDHYIGGDFAPGYRQGRIVERLDALIADGDITTDDMIALQGETRSSLGEGMRDAIVAALDHALGDPSDDAVLDAYVTGIGADGVADLTMARDRLEAWTFATPHGVDATAAGEIADSVATSIFNAAITRLTGLAFGDEGTAIGDRPNGLKTARLLEWCLMDAAAQQALPLYTYRADYLGVTGWSDSVLWDDMTTDDIETRDERVAQAVIAAIAFLETRLGTDPTMWRWGRLHAVRFGQIVPSLDGQERVSIPPAPSTELPIGFPRSGDFGAVDVGNFGMFGGENFTHGSGASQRLVVEMTPEGPRAFNALPGGQRENPEEPHHADEAEHWRVNAQPALYFDLADVEAHEEARLHFGPN